MTDLVPICLGGVADPTERRERMEHLARGSRAESTWRSYAIVWVVWETWASANGATPWPADPTRVAAFLTDLTATHRIATVKRYLAAISVGHTLKGFRLDRKHAAITTILRGAARGAPVPRRVRPLMSKQIRALLADLGDGPADRRDAALLSLGVASGCRRSELAGLDWAKRVDGTDGTGVLALSEDGATITLHTSKTMRGGEAEVIYLQPGIALKAVKLWIATAALAEGSPLFRAVDKAGGIAQTRLTAGAVALIVKARCAAGGLEPAEFAGHSLRAGMVTSAAEADVPEWKIRMTSRHKSDALKTYIRPVEKKKHALTSDIGL
jgi:integrase